MIVHSTSLYLIFVLFFFAPVHAGVPQGLVLGPMPFSMSAIIDSHYHTEIRLLMAIADVFSF